MQDENGRSERKGREALVKISMNRRNREVWEGGREEVKRRAGQVNYDAAEQEVEGKTTLRT